MTPLRKQKLIDTLKGLKTSVDYAIDYLTNDNIPNAMYSLTMVIAHASKVIGEIIRIDNKK